MKLDTSKKKFIAAAVVVGTILLLIIIISRGAEEEQAPGNIGVSQTTPTPASGSGAIVISSLGGVAVNESGEIDTNFEGAKWKSYSVGSNATIQLPPEIEISKRDNTTSVNIGTNNQSLEYAYNISLKIETINTNGRSLKEIAQSDLNAVTSDFVSQTKPVTSVKYGNNNGFTYSVKGMGPSDYYYFDLGDGKYLQIISNQRDLEDQLSSKIINNILSSLQY